MTFYQWPFSFSLLPSSRNPSPLTRCLYPWTYYLLLLSFFRLQALLQARVALSNGTASGIAKCFGKSVGQQISLGGRGRYPAANIGIPCGKASGINILDSDSEQTRQKIEKRISFNGMPYGATITVTLFGGSYR